VSGKNKYGEPYNIIRFKVYKSIIKGDSALQHYGKEYSISTVIATTFTICFQKVCSSPRW